MKTRNGFVSNSSSSSFVILGYKAGTIISENINKEEMIKKFATNKLKQYDHFEDTWWDFLYNTNFGIEGITYLSDDREGYIGLLLAEVRSEDGGLENKVISMEEVTEKIGLLQKLFGITDTPKFFIGTRSC